MLRSQPNGYRPPPRLGELGSLPPPDKVGALELPEMGETSGQQPPTEKGALNPFASIIPLLTAFPGPPEVGDKAEPRPLRYLVEKGLPTLPTKLVERVWNLEYVDMEEFLPAPRSLRIAEQGRSSASLQESLVGAFSQFQALQQYKTQRRVTDILTWTRCFSLYMAVLSKKAPEMVPSMVAHLHTVLRLQQKASSQLAWLEYDIQFRMELAASADRAWTCGDPWQYISCLPGPSSLGDPFEMSVEDTQPSHRPGVEKGKRPMEPEAERGVGQVKLPAKKPKKTGVCRLFNSAPGGCPYGRECIFVHRCNNCGALNEHHRLACPFPQKPSRD